MTIVYPYIPADRTIKYTPARDRFMRAAETACLELSTDRHHQTGAVLVKDGAVVARAANQSVLKNERLLAFHGKGWCVRKLFKIPSGRKYWLCPGCASARNHSETLVVKAARRLGIDTAGVDIYLWGHWWCCELCWRAMNKAGIRDVYLLEGSEKLFNKNHPDNIIGK